MTKEQFVTASKNIARFYSGIELPLTAENIMEKEDCNYFFFWERYGEYVDNDDNDIECTFWYTVSNYKEEGFESKIELATGIDGRRGDHFIIDYKDWLQS